MKKLLTVAAIALSSVAVYNTAIAQGFNDGHKHNTQQGFVDESVIVKTVDDALNANDDTPVRLDGQIVKQIGKKDFLFKDASGKEIQIEVSKKAWNGETIAPQDNIQIIGKVDKEWNKTEVDVKQIIKKRELSSEHQNATDGDLYIAYALMEAAKQWPEKGKGYQQQAKAILAMQLRRLTGLEREAVENELRELLKLIARLEAILADEQEILNIIKTELLEMKEKYGDERKTKIINHELGKFSDEELIPEEESVILLTGENYIKRTLLTDYRRQNRGGKGKRGMTTKDQDIIDQLVPASTHDWLLFFTNKGRVFRLKAYEVPAASLQAKGVAAVNLLQLQPEEKITSIIKLEQNSSTEDYLFMATVKGTVKKTAIKDFTNIRTNGLNAINLDEGDELRWIQKTDGQSDIIVSTSAGQAVRFNENDVRSMGRAARGVRGVRLRPNDNVVGMDVAKDGTQKLLVISANGYGKATKVSNFEVKHRGGIGVKAAITTAKTGPIVSVQTLPEAVSDALMISSCGQTIRVAVKDIPTLGRTTQGVRIMKLSEGDTVASVGLMEESREEE